MRVVPVDEKNAALFTGYCRTHGPEHDGSYLPAGNFDPDVDNPSYLIVNSEGECEGAVSLILTPAFRDAGKGRFRIYHAVRPEPAIYGFLWRAIRAHTAGIQHVYLFLPEEKTVAGGILERLGFAIQRYSWELSRPSEGVPPPIFPPGFALVPFRPGEDETIWCEIVNRCFAPLAGHTDMTPADLARMRAEEDILPDGLLILRHGRRAVGTMQVSREEENGPSSAVISALAVLPEYRGRGLGRNMLRVGAEAARRHNLPRTVLTVNAENKRAAELYLDEGFAKERVYVCYDRDLTDDLSMDDWRDNADTLV